MLIERDMTGTSWEYGDAQPAGETMPMQAQPERVLALQLGLQEYSWSEKSTPFGLPPARRRR